MVNNTYNGYTNYETWSANLHYSDSFFDIAKEAVERLDTESEEFAEDFDLEDFKDTLADTFEELVWEVSGVNDLPDGIAKDFAMGALERVDWHDIADTHLSDFEELEAFMNPPENETVEQPSNVVAFSVA
jgi:hypothetical protein